MLKPFTLRLIDYPSSYFYIFIYQCAHVMSEEGSLTKTSYEDKEKWTVKSDTARVLQRLRPLS